MKYSSLLSEMLEKISEYVSRQRLENLKELASNAKIDTVNHLPDVISLKSKDGTLTVRYPIEKNSPQVIDFSPILYQGKPVFFYPVMIVPSSNEKERLWKTVHEICHLFSIGEYEITDYKKISHQFGLNHYQYEIADTQKIICTQKTVCYRENEIFNDAVTWYFCEKIYGREIPPPDKYIDFHCRSIKNRKEIPAIISHYFDGQSKTGDEFRKIFAFSPH